MANEKEFYKETKLTVSGKVKVDVYLKGSERRYNSPDIEAEIKINADGSTSDFQEQLDNALSALRTKILISVGMHDA